MFSSKSFIVSGLIYKSFIHFEFIFVHSINLPGSSGGKEYTCNTGDPGLIPDWEDLL